MKRRVVPVRLVPDTEHPEDRTDFRHPDLEEWVRDSPRRAARGRADHLAELDRQGQAGSGSRDGQLRPVGPHGRRRAAGRRDRAASAPTPPTGSATPTMTTAGAITSASCAPGSATSGSPWPTSPTPSRCGYLKRPPVKRDPDKTLAAAARATPTGRSARDGTATCGWSGRTSRDSASGGRTWSVQTRADPLIVERPEPSSASSVSSAAPTDPQVSSLVCLSAARTDDAGARRIVSSQ